MSENGKTIVEIKGVCMEVDLRSATQVTKWEVGTKCKILLTPTYGSPSVHVGVIVGFDSFESLPTITIAYVKNELDSSGKVEFLYFNDKIENVELCPVNESDILPTQETIRMYFDKSISKIEGDLQELQRRRDYFLKQYGLTFETSEETATPSE